MAISDGTAWLVEASNDTPLAQHAGPPRAGVLGQAQQVAVTMQLYRQSPAAGACHGRAAL